MEEEAKTEVCGEEDEGDERQQFLFVIRVCECVCVCPTVASYSLHDHLPQL